MLRKLTPISLGGGGYRFALGVVTGACFESTEDKLRSPLEGRGRASARTLSRGRTSAERLRDLRKARREEDKWNHTFPGLARAKICRCSVLYGQMTMRTEGHERMMGSRVLQAFLP